MSIYDIKVTDNRGNEVSMSDYKGKVLLIVNTATGCGFTPQYEGLEKMYEKFVDRGFEILDFPCNQFAFQAKGSDEQIHEFCTLNYNTKFPRFKKIKVNGGDAAEIFKYLKEQKKGRIKWNFTKFLVDSEGNVVDRFEPTTKPEDIEASVEKLLK
ncbi:MAG: glutathione peroxidase [Clostridiales bacterium]|nr:glutathione peroxidase [Clostridia bacterium]MCR4563017.1 glutathione peroxidase [Clostridiales bacterium]